MKNITLSAEEDMIRKARLVANQRGTSLQEMFRDWLRDLTRGRASQGSYDRLMERLGSRRCGRVFGREEMNER